MNDEVSTSVGISEDQDTHKLTTTERLNIALNDRVSVGVGESQIHTPGKPEDKVIETEVTVKW